MRSSFSMSLLYHAYVYLEFLILACTIYILAPGCLNFSREEVEKVNLNTLRAEIVMDGISVRISSGLGVINTDNKEPDNAFILDCEYYQVGKLNMDEIGEVAEGLHQKSTDFFRKSITRKLHEAMEPQELK